MTVRQIEITDRWLSHVGAQGVPVRGAARNRRPVAPRRSRRRRGRYAGDACPRDPAASMRFCYPGKLATSVRGRLKRLQQGANPAELQLGHDCSVEQSHHAAVAPRRALVPDLPAPADLPAQTVELCAGGVPAAYFRVSGRTFERKDPARPPDLPGPQHLQRSARSTDYDRCREEAERDLRWERWQGTLRVARGLACARVRNASHRWFLEQLVTLRDDERSFASGPLRAWRSTGRTLGAVGQLAFELQLWPGSPRGVTVRPHSSAFSEDPPLPAIELDESPDDKPLLVLPPRTFDPGPAYCARSIPGPSAAFG